MNGFTRLIGFGLFCGVVLLLALAAILPSGRSPTPHSVFSVERDGLRAAYLFLAELGQDVAAWTEAPGKLVGEDVLVSFGVPDAPPGAGGPGEEVRRAGSRRLRDPLHYLRFVEEGGTLVVALSEDMQAFLRDELGLAELEDLEPLPGRRTERSTWIFASGERFERMGDGGIEFAPLSPSSPFVVLAADEEGAARVVRLRVGRGRIVIATTLDFLDNHDLEEGDHGLFLARFVELLAPRGRLWFDEYALGGWVPETPLELALAADNAPFTLHLIGLALVLLWSAAWVRGFPRDPQPLSQLSATARVRALSGLLLAARRFDLLARLLTAGVLRRLDRGVRGSSAAGEDETGSPPALEPARVRTVLGAHAARLGGTEGLERATALFTREVRDANALAQLAAELSALESRLGSEEPAARTRPSRRGLHAEASPSP